MSEAREMTTDEKREAIRQLAIKACGKLSAISVLNLRDCCLKELDHVDTLRADLAAAKKQIEKLEVTATDLFDIGQGYKKWILQQTKDIAAERAKVKLAIKLIFDAKKTGTYPLGNEETLMNWLTETTQDEESA